MSGSPSNDDFVTVDFDGRSPTDTDIPYIASLLSQTLPQEINCTSIAEIIVSHNYVGTVLVQAQDDDIDAGDDEDESPSDVFGVVSCINLKPAKESATISSLCSFLLNGPQDLKQQFSEVFSSNTKLGWLINERFTNLPAETAVSMLSSLNDDIDVAVKKNMAYKFDAFLFVAKVFVAENLSDTTVLPNQENLNFAYPEMEIFYANSTWKCFVFGDNNQGEEVTTALCVIYITEKQFHDSLEAITNSFS